MQADKGAKSHLTASKSARQGWKTLEETYAPRTKSTDRQIAIQIFAVKAAEGDDMEAHIGKMHAIRNQI